MPTKGIYLESIKKISKLHLPFEKFSNKAIIISGASGMIGRCLIDTIMYVNNLIQLNIDIYAICRNKERANIIFKEYLKFNNFKLVIHNINEPLILNVNKLCYAIHLASNTHPISYANNPIDTLLTNVIGLKNMLDLSANNNCIRYLFASSVEIYGDNDTNNLYFKESDLGYIDCNSLRATYNEGKRAGEALCNAYNKEKGIDFVIARIARSYGPTQKKDDSKALSQFIFDAIDGKDIVIKSKGEQLFSYIYVFDVVSALLTILLKGESKNAYNISDVKSNIKLKDLAQIVCKICNRKIIFDLPSKEETEGFSKSAIALMDAKKLNDLGWSALYDLETGLKDTIEIIKQKELDI